MKSREVSRKHRRMHWATYLWPGLPHLWLRGSWAGLALAIGFTVLLNVTAVSIWVYPEWLAPRLKLACSGATLLVWVVALVETRGELRRLSERREAESAGTTPREEAVARQRAEEADRRFADAQQDYLRGDWIAAERLLLELLRCRPEDVEGRLLLATVWRRQNRRREAAGQLRKLDRMEAAGGWRMEIENERCLLTSEKGESGPLDAPDEPQLKPNPTRPAEQSAPAA
ncbi:hypothetical protein Pla175_12430 [Pirellulimonas nuda]|uniref:Tetratricopeptide repeat protein n=1 Tax=Pirellulimonas nuda TaxID=2528009 RepID=A0A518D8S7_9BACT|nr:hypothetical protein [Pirellulimonas nuda]QDU87876.1 hypothetical protein Pla175_12430 [Pirellulimonas nuda]